jgi:hypothetical protein
VAINVAQGQTTRTIKPLPLTQSDALQWLLETELHQDISGVLFLRVVTRLNMEFRYQDGV